MLKRIKYIYVPGCKQKLIVKAGKQKAMHFAHYKKTCHLFSEGETQEHLQGKYQLYHWLKEIGLNSQIEAYMSNLKQRPDIISSLQSGEKIVFEFQCAPISTEKLISRSYGYANKKLKFFWILGQRYRLKKKLTQQIAQFIRWTPNLGFYLIYLDVGHKRFEICYAIQQADYVPIKYLKHYAYSLKELHHFLHIKHKPKYFPLTLIEIKQQMANFRSRIFYNDPGLRNLRNKCYVRGLTLYEIPTDVFPQRYCPPIYRVPSFIWKMSVLLLKGESNLSYLELASKELQKSRFYNMPFIKMEYFFKLELRNFLATKE